MDRTVAGHDSDESKLACAKHPLTPLLFFFVLLVAQGADPSHRVRVMLRRAVAGIPGLRPEAMPALADFSEPRDRPGLAQSLVEKMEPSVNRTNRFNASF